MPKSGTCSHEISLKACFSDPFLDVMNFLNEVVMQYPNAISFAPGRPPENCFHVESGTQGISVFVAEMACRNGLSVDAAWNALGQYNRTNGIINDLLAAQLKNDEGIDIAPEDIIVTVGAQEAMTLVMMGLFEPGRDVLLASDPTYIGITGLARILGIEVISVASDENGLSAEAVEKAIAGIAAPKRARALYDIPDFNNPMGTCMPLDRRLKLIQLCRYHEVLIVEDNAYGMFAYEATRIPTLKALDQDGIVLYIGSFSKTLFPSLRLGYLVAGQRIAGTGSSLAMELSKIKSLVTVNTPSITQAMAGAALMSAGNSLRNIVRSIAGKLRCNRDVLLDCLGREFAGMEDSVCWNRPLGGFFLTLTVPFKFDLPELRRCARDYGVIVCPMNFFSLLGNRDNQIRLSFSYLQEEQIRIGVERLARFIRNCSEQ